jgi:hypothetical protein
MIVLERNVATTFVVTLLENTTITTVFYLLQLTSSIDVVSYFSLTEESTSLQRYNKFTLDVEDLPVGEYEYTIYQCDVEEPTIEDAQGIVEKGIAIITDDGIIDTIYE